MTDNDDHQAATPADGTDSTVTDWHGQDVDRDIRAADEALAAAGGDQDEAEEIFDSIRPEHRSDRFNVPAEEREGTVPGSDGAGAASSA
jgi:hypothetical protein